MQCDSTEDSSMRGNLPVGAQIEVLLLHGHQCHCQCCFQLDWFLQECYCLVWWAAHWGCQMKLRLSLRCTTWAGSRLARHESKAPAYRTNVSCDCARPSGVIPTEETGHSKLCLPEMSHFCWEIKANQQLPAMLDAWESMVANCSRSTWAAYHSLTMHTSTIYHEMECQLESLHLTE